MKRLGFLLFVLLLGCHFSAEGRVKVGLEQKTVGGSPNNLRLFYVALSDYASAPFNIWNSQVMTLRWSTTLGDDVIQSLTNPSAFSFSLDGAAADGGDGFYYQKFTASSTAVSQSISMGDSLEVLVLELVHASIATGDFELVTSPNSWVTSNFGTASINAAVGGEQFDSFDPATALAVPLPLELLAFEAKAQAGYIHLEWQSQNEQDFSHFLLERSTDGKAFINLASIPGLGIAEAKYEYDDWKVHPHQWYYYRLKMLDLDGQFSYSPIRSARLSSKDAGLISLSPNPVRSEATVSFDAPFERPAYLSIVDVKGQVLWERKINFHKGLQQLPLNLESLAAGQYTLHIGPMNTSSEWQVSFIKIDEH